MAVMLDLLLGSPGETAESLTRTIEPIKRADPDRAGVSVGVRLYPEPSWPAASPSRSRTRARRSSSSNRKSHRLFFDLLGRLIGEDSRFLVFDPPKPGLNCNYNENKRLIDLIARGHRGAYWNIVRRWG
jgi:hypothetical protein